MGDGMAGTDYERLAFQYAPDATLILLDRVILRASLRVEEVFGWAPREVEGQSIRMLYPGQTDFQVIGPICRRKGDYDLPFQFTNMK